MNDTTLATPISATPAAVTTAQNPIREPTEDEQRVINEAEKQRRSALTIARDQVGGLLAQYKRSGGTSGVLEYNSEDQKIIDKIQYWLYLQSVGEKFWDAVEKFHDLMTKNLALGTMAHWVDTVKTDHAYVYGDDKSRGVFFCLSVYFTDNPLCQREVILHEYFHFLGLDHYYTTDKTDEALQCAHHMAELVFDIATGCTGGCKTTAVCR